MTHLPNSQEYFKFNTPGQCALEIFMIKSFSMAQFSVGTVLRRLFLRVGARHISNLERRWVSHRHLFIYDISHNCF